MYTVWIDASRRHRLVFAHHTSGPRATLYHDRGDRRSALHEALRGCLRIRADGGPLKRLTSPHDALGLPPDTRSIEVILADSEGHPTRTIYSLTVGENFTPKLPSPPYTLSPFECRFLAETGHPHVLRVEEDSLRDAPPPTTDLHTHFSGCIGGADLLEIALEADLSYPVEHLEFAGIHTQAHADAVALRSLTPPLRARLIEQLGVSGQARITFLDMERIYRLRAPITKHPDLFLPLCQRIARDYARMGVRYAELSLSQITEAARLRAVHDWMPALRRETGVDLRFLAAMSRHSDLEWDLDYIERVQSLQTPDIVGVDFMGHETNSTHAFARRIRDVAAWAHDHRPGFVIRVHAGENPAHPENVQVALDCTRDLDVQLRIGHGLYGVDDATLATLARRRVIVEFNLNSNLALNNIQSTLEVPLLRYARAGARVVLGTDGYGIYDTTPAMEQRAARLSGLRGADLEAIHQTEAWYLDRRAQLDATPYFARGDVPDDQPHRHFTSQRVEARREAAHERRARLDARLRAASIPILNADELDALLTPRRHILSFAGAWKKSWAHVSAPQRVRIDAAIAELFAALPPEQTVILTGGTHFGVEQRVQRLARRHNLMSIGTLAADIHPDTVDITHISRAFIIAETIYQKAAELYRLVQSHAGVCVFIGGGAVVSDEIQTARNLRIHHLLMDGPEGASTQHARQHPHLAFERAEDILRALHAAPWRSTEGAYWHRGANPTADAVVLRRNPRSLRREVLLIRRHQDAATEPDTWALPGGFVHTDAPRGEPWRAGAETPLQACVRELYEETGLDLTPHLDAFQLIGAYEGGGRDPRDTPTAWSRSSAFAIILPGHLTDAPIAGNDDAEDALWIPIHQLPWKLAFDHARVLADALERVIF